MKATTNNHKVKAVDIGGDTFFKISDINTQPPFFMNMMSSSNHWMFISSNGGLTAGRINADYALFPYYTEDKITESISHTGNVTIIKVKKEGEEQVWEPFSNRYTPYSIQRNLYKHVHGHSIIFEEIHNELNLSFSYKWSSSDKYGFVKTSRITNHSNQKIDITILDGLQNIMPACVGSDLQNTFSNLVDAYKYAELLNESQLGIFTVNAIISDRAEPSESLFVNIAWHIGFDSPKILLSSKQIERFRSGFSIETENRNLGERGAYCISKTIELQALDCKEWQLICDVHKSQSDIVLLNEQIKSSQLTIKEINTDIEKGSYDLIAIASSIDGIQLTGDEKVDARHYSNTMFNAMRGGMFPHGYSIVTSDFSEYIRVSNKALYTKYIDFLLKLPTHISIQELKGIVSTVNDLHLLRLASEYLPLTFSRRHGDPSRPWNRFSINTKNDDGSLKYDFQGNWRDIFQNWEALSHSYPLFVESMIYKFMNASTFDGYNPYRIQKNGFDWETIEEHNPWSYIGYWGDHQIIYLLKLLEMYKDTQPFSFQEFITKNYFVYAHVPYKIKSYQDIVNNPKQTIDFDHVQNNTIKEMIHKKGTDGALLLNHKGEIHKVSYLEKILAISLAKVSNYVPGGGIWMNTQRPEWNDANNALVGNGTSMVTLHYLHRFINMIIGSLEKSNIQTVELSEELSIYLQNTTTVLQQYDPKECTKDDAKRKSIMDELGIVASSYRNDIYENTFSGNYSTIEISKLISFFQSALHHIHASIINGKRSDGLYHAYNLLTIENDKACITHLPEMLEGQVSILSSGNISLQESIDIITALRKSALYREDQHSYMLYPIKEVKNFLQKNIIPHDLVQQSTLLKLLLHDNNQSIITKDSNGMYRFNGIFKNASDLRNSLDMLEEKYFTLVEKEANMILSIYEHVFHHKEFTGRSGTFFGYEGIGSIYWHMVSKLRYAVQETYQGATQSGAKQSDLDKLQSHYVDITEGLGIHSSPERYGAFPTDPYSHTPLHRGAQQPGMTGQVKEDILCRIRELGVYYKSGMIHFYPNTLSLKDFLVHDTSCTYVDINGITKALKINKGSLFFTLCQIPIIYSIADESKVEICKSDDTTVRMNGMELDLVHSESMFSRDKSIRMIQVSLNKHQILQ
ncbi:MAG: hypothetical protein EBU66_08325 [Bacteroidetes bacterium]|nr:hypothetical protein [Bacteroidota bacterium]